MIITTPTGTTGRNCLLEALSETTSLRAERLQEVEIRYDEILVESGGHNSNVYLVHDGLISLMNMMEDGRSVQTGLVGKEGIIGHPYLADFDAAPAYAVVTVPGHATRLPAEELFAAMEESPEVRDMFGRFARAFLAQTLQTVACNAVHSAESRLAKWLLQCADRVDNGVPLTQELVAQMLGVSRPTVTLTLRKLRDGGTIEQQRKQIRIVDRGALEASACPCYRTIRNAYEQLLPLTFSDIANVQAISA